MNKHLAQNNPCRFLVCMICTVILLFSALSAAPASAEATAQKNLDVVILLDNSRSMYKRDNQAQKPEGSDVNGYRIDAAQMFISMCDMNGTRVAVIPFTKNPSEREPQFVTLDSERKRDTLIAELDKLRTNTSGYTDIGEALSIAVKLLAEAGDPNNDPMILVLSDGHNDLPIEGKAEPVKSGLFSFWNVDSASFETKNIKKYKNSDADALCEASTDAAKHLGIPLYTITFFNQEKDKENYVKQGFDFMQRMSNKTEEFGGRGEKIGSDNAYTLPQTFGKMLAENIGSSLVMEFTPEPVEGKPNTYTIDIPIPNSSVMEANLYIPLRGKDGKAIVNSVKLINPDGTDISSGNGQSVLRHGSEGNFILYKLRNARQGSWKLEYVVNQGKLPDDVSFSVLYNYNISLQTIVGLVPTDMNQPNDPLEEFNKEQKLIIRSRFISNQTNQPAEDTALYRSPSVSDDWQIKARYEWRDETGRVLFDGEIPTDITSSMFETDLPLSSVYQSESGGNLLRSGIYELVVTAEGAGLTRSTSQRIQLTNNPVTFNGDPTVGIDLTGRAVIVDDPAIPASKEPQEVKYLISDYFSDADGDKLRYMLSATDPSVPSIIDMELAEEAGKTYIVGMTKKNASENLIMYGTREYNLTVSDNDSDIVVPLRILIVNKTVSDQRLIPHIATPDNLAGGVAQKNDTLLFSAKIIDSETGYPDTTGAYTKYTGTVTFANADNITESVTKDFVLNHETKTLDYEYTTDSRSKRVIATFNFKYDGRELGDRNPQAIAFEVHNDAPIVLTDALNDQPSTLKHQSKTFPPVLERVSTEEERTINLEELFAENDQEELQYEIDFSSQNQAVNVAEVIHHERTENTVVLNVSGHAPVTMNVTATDGDGQTATFTRRYDVVDLSDRWTTYWLIAVAALIILAILISSLYVASLPAYNAKVKIELYENQSVGSSATRVLPSGKNRKKSASINVLLDGEVAARNHIDTARLSGVKIAPRRHARDGAVNLWADRVPDGMTVTLNGTNITSKPVMWSPNGEIRISAQGGSIRLVMSIDDTHGFIPQQNQNGNAGGFGGFGDSVTSNGFGNVGGFGDSVTPNGSGNVGGFGDSVTSNGFGNVGGFGNPITANSNSAPINGTAFADVNSGADSFGSK